MKRRAPQWRLLFRHSRGCSYRAAVDMLDDFVKKCLTEINPATPTASMLDRTRLEGFSPKLPSHQRSVKGNEQRSATNEAHLRSEEREADSVHAQPYHPDVVVLITAKRRQSRTENCKSSTDRKARRCFVHRRQYSATARAQGRVFSFMVGIRYIILYLSPIRVSP